MFCYKSAIITLHKSPSPIQQMYITCTNSVLFHQQNVKTSPAPRRGVMVPLVLLVNPDRPWSTFSVKFQNVWISMHRSGPDGPRGPQPPLVDHEHSGPPWTTLGHFPDACAPITSILSQRQHYSKAITSNPTCPACERPAKRHKGLSIHHKQCPKRQTQTKPRHRPYPSGLLIEREGGS